MKKRSASPLIDIEEFLPDDDMINLLTNKIEIDDKVFLKYSKMFNDFGTKEIYPVNGKGVMNIQEWEVCSALSNISFEKATSWDYIPGDAFKILYDLRKKENSKYKTCCKGVASLLSELLKGEIQIPEQMFCARLFCLNKCPEQNGKLENIRPISIIGVLIKILERVIQGRVEMFEKINKIKINKEQVGFVKGLGCDVNIMRLRQRVHDIKLLRTKDEKYVFFIDLKAAYDSVNHKKLFLKMEKKGYSDEIINAIKVIYSSARMRLNTLQKPININRGVMQGGILSPWLFNIYIDDLIDDLKKKTFEVLAYADDLAVICKSKNELDDVIDVLEDWASENDIQVNKKKSGILIIENDRNDMYKHRGYPIKTNYKYLGIRLNNNLNPRGGLEDTYKKLEVYLRRNNWINKHTLTPKSLVTLSTYYQRSRTVYGMACFMDMKDIIERVEKGNMQYTKSILGLSNQVNSDRLRVVLNRPLDRHSLWALMRKNIIKYKNHFNEEPWIFNKINNKYEIWLKGEIGDRAYSMLKLEKENYGKFKRNLGNISIRHLAKKDKICISDNYDMIHKKKYFMAWDKRDKHMIKYLLNYGFYKERFIPQCKHCEENNSRKHVTNSCPAFDDLRKRTWKEINEIRKARVSLEKEYNGDLESLFLDMYFKPGEHVLKDLEVLKKFALQLAITNSRLEKRELE